MNTLFRYAALYNSVRHHEDICLRLSELDIAKRNAYPNAFKQIKPHDSSRELGAFETHRHYSCKVGFALSPPDKRDR